MSIALSANDSEDITQFAVFPSLESNFVSFVFDNYVSKALGLLSFLLLFYALFYVQTSRPRRNGNGSNQYAFGEQQINVRPKSLHNLLHSVAVKAKMEGALSSMSVSAI